METGVLRIQIKGGVSITVIHACASAKQMFSLENVINKMMWPYFLSVQVSSFQNRCFCFLSLGTDWTLLWHSWWKCMCMNTGGDVLLCTHAVYWEPSGLLHGHEEDSMGTQNININYFIYSVSVFHSWDLALFVKGSWWRKQRLKQNRRKLLSINFAWTRRGSGFLSEPVEQTGRVNLTEDTLNFKGFGSHLWCQQWNCSSACPC